MFDKELPWTRNINLSIALGIWKVKNLFRFKNVFQKPTKLNLIETYIFLGLTMVMSYYKT